MQIHRNKLVTGAGALMTSALLLLAVPTGTTEALRKPPMPCVAVRVGAYPVGSGFCPGTTSGIDWRDIVRRLEAQR